MSQERTTIQPGHTASRAVASHSNSGAISRATVTPLQKMRSDGSSEEELPLQQVAISRGPEAAIQPFALPRTSGSNGNIDAFQQKEAWPVVQQRQQSTEGARSEAPAVLPGSHTAPVTQLMSKKDYQQLSRIFTPQVKWPEFHAEQLRLQNDIGNAHNAREQYDYTTFGTEYEMIPYKADNAIANTAHIKLAEGIEMPVKTGVKEVLVTDSDNVIEYVSPVFMLPLDKMNSNPTNEVVWGIAQIKKKLADFKKNIHGEGFSNFKALLTSGHMQFTTWQMLNQLDISFREIDENTDVNKLRAFGNTVPDIEGIELGFDNLNKFPKHKELKNGQEPGSSMQSTVLLPLDLVAKIVRESMDRNSEKAQQTGSIQNKAKKGPPVKSKGSGSGVSGVAGVLIDGLVKALRSAQHNETLVDLIYLFSQRLSLVLEAPNAVKFQAHYQSLKFDPQGGGTITDGGLLEKYDKEEEQYNEAKTAGKTSEVPNNFHNAHSSIKDRLSVWTRIHMDDLVVALGRNLERDEKVTFLGILNEITAGYEEVGAEIQSKIKQALGRGEYIQHDSVHFLDEHPEYIDLRQDTLRNVQEIDGRPWVLIEIRDLKDTTLQTLAEYGNKPRR